MSSVVIGIENKDLIREPIEKFLMKCKIEFNGNETDCNLSYELGSFYSETDMPQFCYSIYSLWGKPDGERQKIPKGSVIQLKFSLNTTQRYYNKYLNLTYQPKYNLPDSPSIQMSIHSPYFSHSPFTDGDRYIGGRNYEVKVSMNEKHLLPAPYASNCTDYMKVWRERGGKAPIDQSGVISECKMNKTYETIHCIPIDVDYPQPAYNICRTSYKGSYSESSNSSIYHECLQLNTELAQPCASVSYTTAKEIIPRVTFSEIGQRIYQKEVDCIGYKMWRPECGEINIFIRFDKFEISNMTYQPKIETLEIFSVIGGYLGLWLGISLVTIYDMLGTFFEAIKRKTRNDARRRMIPKKMLLTIRR